MPMHAGFLHSVASAPLTAITASHTIAGDVRFRGRVPPAPDARFPLAARIADDEDALGVVAHRRASRTEPVDPCFDGH
jgi:hypothetical protein